MEPEIYCKQPLADDQWINNVIANLGHQVKPDRSVYASSNL